MKITNPQIKKLLVHYKEITLLNKIKALLEWDLNVNLPAKAGEERAAQTAYLAEKITSAWHNQEFRSALESVATNIDTLQTLEEKAIVRNLLYKSDFYYKVPKEIITKREQVTSEAFPIWKKAKETNDYNSFFPYLKEIITINQIIAQHLGYKENPYDALLHLYEPELTTVQTAKIFGNLQKELVALLTKIKASKHYTTESTLINEKMYYPIAEQKRLSLFLMQRMGFDFDAGKLDESPHPFTLALSRHDVRATTRYKHTDFMEPITSTIHETGHALYELGVNEEYSDTPLEEGVSFAVHEALSRFWENLIGRNPAFLHFLTPMLQSAYPEQLGAISHQQLVKEFNLVRPSLIRIEADEITYSLHIILRFEMENELMNGKIKPEEAADAWRAKSKKLFGIEPPTDSEGIMQDVHWTYGAMGYFPSYALGNLYGAQFLAEMKKEVDVEKELLLGNLLPIKAWLDINLHQHGSLHFPKDLIKKVTGKPLDPKYFVKYLTEKYSKIYEI